MIEASIVRVPKQKRTRDEQEIVPQDAMPVEGSPSMRRYKDMQARWTKQYGQSHFGDKLCTSTSLDKRHERHEADPPRAGEHG